MKNMIFAILIIFIVTFTVSYTDAKMVPFNDTLWEIEADDYEFQEYLGQKTLWLKNGFALVKNSGDFKDGVIEFDIALPKKRGFSGVMWRVEDAKNYEEFYLRHHQSGNPDANQYSPVYNGLAAWQLYFSGDDFGYPIKYKFGQWMHVKIVISGDEAEIYIDDMDTPIVYIPDLRREEMAGKVGVRGQFSPPSHFANFSLTKNQTPPLKRIAKTIKYPPKGPQKKWALRSKKMRGATEKPLPGLITAWSVSTPFKSEFLENEFNLPAKVKSGWITMETETTGLLNLAQIKGADKALKAKKNTVLAQIKVNSDKDQIKKFQIGFSDRVKVYLNNKIVFAADDSYRSRDYRFLGTIGFFDNLYLPFKKGENVISLAVGEDFGGWGLKAQFLNTNGITIKK